MKTNSVLAAASTGASWVFGFLGAFLFLAAQAFAGTPPSVSQDYTQPTPWTNNTDSTGIWRIAGTWVGTGGNTLLPSLAATQSTFSGDDGTGYLSLRMNPGPSLQGSEIQTLPTTGYSYGYYEARMKLSTVPGGVVSFFIIEAPDYGPHEIDVEFLLNEPWLTTTNQGKVWYSIHGPNGSESHTVTLPFNPSLAFHRYGILWTPGTITWYVDGAYSFSVSRSDLTTTAQMFIMANTWSGNANFGGGPPTSVSTSYYDWMKFWPNATAPQDATTFADWETLFFTAQQLQDSTIAGLNANPAMDGVPNLLKYVFDINPTTSMSESDKAALPVVSKFTQSGDTYLALKFRQKSFTTGITVNLQTSTDLKTWTTVPPDLTQNTGTDAATHDPIMLLGVKTNNATKLFLRLNTTLP